MYAALNYELASQIQRSGDLGSAGIIWDQLTQELLMEHKNLPSKTPSQHVQIISKRVKRKTSSRAPFTAYCALQRALTAHLRSGTKFIKKMKKNLFFLHSSI